MVSEKLGQGGKVMIIDALSCKMNGLPHGFSEKSWMESELSVTLQLDENGELLKILDVSQ